MRTIANELPADTAEGGLLVAVSGGADSVALLRALIALQSAAGESPWKQPVVAAHFDHQLRGDDSADDAAWLGELCESLAVRLIVGREDVAAQIGPNGGGVEESARAARYRFLETAAQQLGYRYVAVAHTANDQVETILHHILRGTGLTGLQGIPRCRPLTESVSLIRPLSIRPLLIRPLMTSRREQVEQYLETLNQPFRHDATNDDLQWTRNRIRHELLPQLRNDFHSGVDDSLLRLGQQAVEMSEVIDSLVDRLLADAWGEKQAPKTSSVNIVRLHCEPFAGQHPYLIRACFVRLWTENNWPRRRMGFSHWDRLATLVGEPTGASDFPDGIEARRRGQLLVLQRKPV